MVSSAAELTTSQPTAPAPNTGAAEPGEPDARAFFANVLDIINPLQHIPVVSTIYRAMTGDEISGPAKLVGGALFGGVVGAAAAAVSVVVEETTGRDVGEHALAMFDSDDAPPTNADQLAAADPAPIRPAAADDPVHIVWNGLRATAATPEPIQQAAATPTAPAVSPPVATPPLLAQSTIEQESAADLAARIAWNGARAPESNAATDAEPAADPATPPADWVGQALADAQTLDAPTDAPAAAPKPWIAGAMLQALEKYEAMAKSRGDGA